MGTAGSCASRHWEPEWLEIANKRLLALRGTAGRGLTPRSSGGPTAGHQARAGKNVPRTASSGLASCPRRPINSNVSGAWLKGIRRAYCISLPWLTSMTSTSSRYRVALFGFAARLWFEAAAVKGIIRPAVIVHGSAWLRLVLGTTPDNNCVNPTIRPAEGDT